MPPPSSLPCLLAVADVRHRVASRLVEGFDEWWQMPAAVLAAAAVAGLVAWMYRRDAAELRPATAVLLAALRLAALAALAAALLDFERIAEHEIDLPSRVAVLVDSSASMSLPEDADPETPRSLRAVELLDAGGLLAALRSRHDVTVWRFDADAEPVARLPRAAAAAAAGESTTGDWRGKLAPRGYETRLGEAVSRVLATEPAPQLAGVVVLSDGGSNAGIDVRAAAAAAAAAGVPIHPVGIGSETVPANVRVADLVAPARAFPGDHFTVAAFLQPQGLAGVAARVELLERQGDGGPGRVLDTTEVPLAADGELVPVRFDVPGLATPGRRTLVVRVVAPQGDGTPADDEQAADLEVVDRVTQVLLMAGGPSREYQFMRNVLERDRSFAVDVLLGMGAAGISQDARRILAAFPPSDEALAGYDAVVAFDYDWRLLEPAAQARLDRWVSGESGGLVLFAGPVFMDSWLADRRTAAIRGLFPVELRRAVQAPEGEPTGSAEPRRLEFTRDGAEAEFLWLAGSRAASEAIWGEFPGVYAGFPSGGAKPGATVYARVAPPVAGVAAEGGVYLAGQFYGSGIVLSFGSGELWRLRAVEEAAYERLVAQLVRHVSQGRLLRGARRARLIVDRDRVPVGASVAVRLIAADAAAIRPPPAVHAVAPDGSRAPITVAADPARPGTLQGAFVASREGGWQIDVEMAGGDGERLSRRVQVQLPDRELARPKLDRGLLAQLASVSGGTPRFVADGPLGPDDVRAITAALPDRSRREYETGAADLRFKQRLNAALLALGCGCLCCEWIVRRFARLA